MFSLVLIKVPKKHESIGANLLQFKYTNKSIDQLYCNDANISYTTYYNTTIPEFNITQQLPVVTMNLNQQTNQLFIFPTDGSDQMTLGSFIGAANSFYCGKNQVDNIAFIFGPNETQLINSFINNTQIKNINIMHSNVGQQYLFEGQKYKINNINIQHYHTMDIYIQLKIQQYTSQQSGMNQYEALLDNATYSLTEQMKQIINQKQSLYQQISQTKIFNLIVLYVSVVIFLLNINVIHSNAKYLFRKSIISALFIRIINFIISYPLSIILMIIVQLVKQQDIQIYQLPTDDLSKYIGLIIAFSSYYSGKYESIHMTKHRATFFLIIEYFIQILLNNQQLIKLYRQMLILQIFGIYVLDYLIKRRVVCREYSANLIYSLTTLGWQLALISFYIRKLIISEKPQIFNLIFLLTALLNNLISQFGPILARVQGKLLVVSGLIFTSILCLNSCFQNIQDQRLVNNALYLGHIIDPIENGNFIESDSYGIIIQNSSGCKLYTQTLSHQIDCFDGDQYLEAQNNDLKLIGENYKRFTFLNKKFILIGEKRDNGQNYTSVLINDKQYQQIPLTLSENYFSRYIIDWYREYDEQPNNDNIES